MVLNILHLEDSPNDAELVQSILETEELECRVARVETKEEFVRELEHNTFDLIFADYRLPSFDGISALSIAKEKSPDIPFILISGTLGEERAVEALKTGAADYLLKQNLVRLGAAVRNALQNAEEMKRRKQAEEMLRVSESRYRTLVNTSPDGITLADLEGKLILCNRQTARMHGYENPEAMRDINVFDLIVPEDRQLAVQNARKTLESGRVDNVEYRMLRKDGSRFQGELSAAVVHDAKGTPEYFMGITRDITERKKVQEQITMLAAALKNINECVSITDLEDNILFVNQSFIDTYGYSENELIGQKVSILRSPNNSPESVRNILPATIKGEWYGELFNRRKDGSEFPILLSTTFIPDKSGEPEALIGVASDISERKLAENILHASEVRYRRLFEAARDGILILDAETGKVVDVNPFLVELLGYSPEQFLGKKIWELGFFKDIAANKLNFAELQLKEHIQYENMPLETATGRLINVEFVSHVYQVNDYRMIQCNIRDITEKLRLEQQFLRTQRMESIGTLAGGIAHDLNNVLGPIMLSLSLFKKKLTDEPSQKMLQMLELTTQRGADLIKQVLSFARGVEGDRTSVQVRHLIDEIGKIIKATFPKSITFRADIPRILPTLSADATQIHQILMNLCVNARDAMPNGGMIEIKAESIILDEQYTRMHAGAKPGSFVVITVTDQGMGIPPASLEKIFEPFYTTKELGKGTGLGLSTVLTIVKNHNGFVNVHSEIGKGTTFKVHLPVQAVAEAAVAKEKATPPAGNGELILVVDDEASIREITKTTLEAYGYSVITAADGTEAVTAYATHGTRIALVMTDMIMPYMDGIATIRALQKMNANVKILAISGMKQDGAVVKQEAVMFLHKPFTSEDLLEIMGELLRRQ